MPKPELGDKRFCPKCKVKFYDLGRATGLCPACGTEVDFAAMREAAAPAPDSATKTSEGDAGAEGASS